MTDITQLPIKGFISETDRVLLYEGLAEEVILDITWSETPFIDGFTAEFEIDSGEYLAEADFYQGMNFTRIITRKTDGRKFGFTYWDSPGNDAMESQYDSNAEDQGFEVEWDNEIDDVRTGGVPGSFWVFLPVEEFHIQGYRVSDGSE